jgi:hypothetical protein
MSLNNYLSTAELMRGTDERESLTCVTVLITVVIAEAPVAKSW